MRRKNRGGDGGGGNEWMNTYADMVTLLLTFFAVLLSISTVNEEKFNEFISSFSNLPPERIEEIIDKSLANAANGEEPTAEEVAEAIDELYQLLKGYVNKNGMDEEISLEKSDDTLYIRFDSSIFFEPDKSIMLPGGYDTMSFMGDGLKQYEDKIKLIAICGHTASVGDIPDYPVSDWDLSAARSAAVGKYLDEEKKIDSKKLLLLGYGKNLPIADNSNEEGRKHNRRVELAIIGIGSDIFFDPYAGLSDLYGLAGGGDTSGESPAPKETKAADDGIEKDVSPYD